MRGGAHTKTDRTVTINTDNRQGGKRRWVYMQSDLFIIFYIFFCFVFVCSAVLTQSFPSFPCVPPDAINGGGWSKGMCVPCLRSVPCLLALRVCVRSCVRLCVRACFALSREEKTWMGRNHHHDVGEPSNTATPHTSPAAPLRTVPYLPAAHLQAVQRAAARRSAIVDWGVWDFTFPPSLLLGRAF